MELSLLSPSSLKSISFTFCGESTLGGWKSPVTIVLDLRLPLLGLSDRLSNNNKFLLPSELFLDRAGEFVESLGELVTIYKCKYISIKHHLLKLPDLLTEIEYL